MRTFILSVLFLCIGTNSFSETHSIDRLLIKLDSLLVYQDEYIQHKENKINELRKRRTSTLKPEDTLWLNKMFYDEFYVYSADSAMTYVNMNIDISDKLGRTDLKEEWLLNKAFLLSATGLLRESEQALNEVNIECLNNEQKFKYYEQKIYLYSHIGQYIGSRPLMVNAYYEREAELKREAQKYITPDDDGYYSFMASLYSDYPREEKGNEIKRKLIEIVEASTLSTRTDAINAYMLARMFYHENDETNYMRYLIYSAMADIKICNRDIASIEELAELLYKY